MLSNIGLTGWVLANIAASAAFTWLASWTWLEPNLRGTEAARGGDALVWMLGAFPVLAFSVLANAVWFAFLVRERRRTGDVWPFPCLTVIAATWIGVLLVDHFRGLGF